MIIFDHTISWLSQCCYLLCLQDRVDYELWAVGFDDSGSIFGAEYMRQVSPLEAHRKRSH